MQVLRTIPELRAAILERRLAGDSVGFVPTMGVMHDGQLSLVRRAHAENGCVVVSSFTHPGDFSTLDEMSPMHRDEHRDLALLERDGADLVFLPEVATLYPPDDMTRVTVEGLTRQLEGASRPGHLDGLTTVMLKMLLLVGPASLYLGQRHAQQVVILRRMMRDLFMNVQTVICATALSAAREAYDAGERSAEVLRARMTELIAAETMARPDYISVADASTLAELRRVTGPALALVAVWIGHTRLTDNMPLAWDVA